MITYYIIYVFFAGLPIAADTSRNDFTWSAKMADKASHLVEIYLIEPKRRSAIEES